MLSLAKLAIIEYKEDLDSLPEGKVLINTINAHSYNVATQDETFAQALTSGDYLIPDGAPIIWACRWLKARSRPRSTGATR